MLGLGGRVPRSDAERLPGARRDQTGPAVGGFRRRVGLRQGRVEQVGGRPVRRSRARAADGLLLVCPALGRRWPRERLERAHDLRDRTARRGLRRGDLDRCRARARGCGSRRPRRLVDLVAGRDLGRRPDRHPVVPREAGPPSRHRGRQRVPGDDGGRRLHGVPRRGSRCCRHRSRPTGGSAEAADVTELAKGNVGGTLVPAVVATNRGSAAGLLGKLVVSTSDRGELVFVTDGSWRLARSYEPPEP